MQATLKIYLAGPDVFFREPLARGQQLRARCAAFGFDGRFPMDAMLPPLDAVLDAEADVVLRAEAAPQTVADHAAAAVDAAELARATSDDDMSLPPTPASALRIFRANIALLRSCDAVMANLQDFRGAEPDSGTVFEVGYAAALGLPVWGYGAPDVPIIDQVPHDATDRDSEDRAVEDFALPRNLMLACSTRIVEGGADACLADMQAILLRRTQPFVPGWIRASDAAPDAEPVPAPAGAR